MPPHAHALTLAILCLLAVSTSEGAASETRQPNAIPVAFGASWSFLDDGSQPDSAWSGNDFVDSSWSQGPAQLGYGDTDVETTVSFGPDPANKYITTYFRHEFFVSDPSLWLRLDLAVIRDDGVIVYLNGTEVLRDNLPTTPVDSSTLALNAIPQDLESTPVSADVDPALLLSGKNTIAVEIHQNAGTSSDLSFDLELSAFEELVPRLSRGPYLQLPTADSVVVRWRTDVATDSRLRYGLTPELLDLTVESAAQTTEHRIEVDGLPADTRYYYAIGSSQADLADASGEHFFTTSPAIGSRSPIRFWALGDAGSGNDAVRRVRDAYAIFTRTRPSDFILLLGDNAYPDGTDDDYQQKFFGVFQRQLNNTSVWPTFGNHDSISADALTQTGPYFEIFDMPKQAEAGGVGSQTEAYYSFDYSNAHFVVLDSMSSSSLPGSAMLTWLEEDLAANNREWTIAAFHHPPYSKGNHDSDVKSLLIQARERFLPILERHGVDLVLTGHSHSYERSQLLDQHYGDSTSLLQSMILDAGDGRVDGDGAYDKPSLGPAPNEGAVYVVTGSAGQVSTGFPLDHPVMQVALPQLGSVVIDIDGSDLDATFLSDQGVILDYFRLHKGNQLHADDFEQANLERWDP